MKHLIDIKEKNKKNVVRTIHKFKKISKKQIAIQLKLSASVMTKLCNELKSESIILELDKAESLTVGRKETLMGINYNFKKIIGVSINHKDTTIVLSNLEPTILSSKIFQTNSDPIQFRNDLAVNIEELMVTNNLSKDEILGIGLSLKGITDGTHAISGMWSEKIEFKQYFEDIFDIPVILDNGVRCSALLENFNSGITDFIVVKYFAAGIGGAIMKNEKLVYGDNYRIADIGHIIIDPNEDYCDVCKRKGCLESIISYERIIADIKSDFTPESLPILYDVCQGNIDNITINTIFIAADSGSIKINIMLRKIASIFAIALINTYSIIDISNIVLTGDIFKHQVFIEYLKSYIIEYQFENFWDKIKISDLSEYALASAILILNKLLY